MKEFIAEAKANPGKLKYATWGPASASNMAMEMLMESAGIKLTFIPFKSSPDSLAAVAGGNADMSVTFALSGMGKSGIVRVLAISDDERLPDYPDVPTLKELGCPIAYKTQYNGLAAPAKTPETVVAKFIDAHKKVLAKYEKDLNDKFPKMELYPVYIDGNPMMQYLKEREKMYRDFFAKIGFKPE